MRQLSTHVDKTLSQLYYGNLLKEAIRKLPPPLEITYEKCMLLLQLEKINGEWKLKACDSNAGYEVNVSTGKRFKAVLSRKTYCQNFSN